MARWALQPESPYQCYGYPFITAEHASRFTAQMRPARFSLFLERNDFRHYAFSTSHSRSSMSCLCQRRRTKKYPPSTRVTNPNFPLTDFANPLILTRSPFFGLLRNRVRILSASFLVMGCVLSMCSDLITLAPRTTVVAFLVCRETIVASRTY